MLLIHMKCDITEVCGFKRERRKREEGEGEDVQRISTPLLIIRSLNLVQIK